MDHDTNKPHGSGPNAVGGGWYTMRRTSQGVNVWSLARDDQNIPGEVKDAATLKDSQQVNPHAQVQPQANCVSSNTCDLDAVIQLQNIIINLNLYQANDDPATFKDAYWDIASLTTLFPTSTGPSKRHHHIHKRNCF